MADQSAPTIDNGWLRGMPAWVPRLLILIAALLATLFFGLGVVRQLRTLLVMLLISVFLSIALEPGVNYLAGKGWRRGLATGTIFLAVGAFVASFIGLMIPLIVDQTTTFVERIPGYVDQLADFAQRFGIDFSSERIASAVTDLEGDLQGIAADVAGSVFGVGSRLLGTVFQLLAIGLFTFYLTADGPRIRNAVGSLLPPQRQHEVLRAWEIAIEKTGGYFYSRALLAAVAAVAGWLAFRIIGVPFALALGIWVGLFSQFVPVVGTYIGGALPLLIALLESPGRAIAVLIYIIAYQQVENYLLAPRITARTMSLHPAVSFGSAIAGGTLLGPAGAIMALPTAATIQAFVSTYLHRYEVIPGLRSQREGEEAAD